MVEAEGAPVKRKKPEKPELGQPLASTPIRAARTSKRTISPEMRADIEEGRKMNSEDQMKIVEQSRKHEQAEQDSIKKEAIRSTPQWQLGQQLSNYDTTIAYYQKAQAEEKMPFFWVRRTAKGRLITPSDMKKVIKPGSEFICSSLLELRIRRTFLVKSVDWTSEPKIITAVSVSLYDKASAERTGTSLPEQEFEVHTLANRELVLKRGLVEGEIKELANNLKDINGAKTRIADLIAQNQAEGK